MIASEAVPFAKTGGLADVAGSLPRALARLGQDVTLVLPRYRGIPVEGTPLRLPVMLGGRTLEAEIFLKPLGDGARVALIDCPELYDREALYGAENTDYPDNPRRFAFLARAALEFVARTGEAVSILHAHDWQAGLVPVYLKTHYAAHPRLSEAASLLTIHNLAYQGLFPAEWLPTLDLGWEHFVQEGLEFWGQISFLKGGVNFAHLLSTVSPTYAREIQTPELGCGFDGILSRRAADLHGVLNGIDVEVWDPARDEFLSERYDAAHVEKKRAAKAALFEVLGLPAGNESLARPLVGMVSRMIDQKGLDLIAAATGELLGLVAGFAVLGTGEERYQAMWRDLAARHPDRIAARIGFDERLAHLIEAGADIFLMPSRFEPCGLSQMYSMRYGTVPVVRATGGLEDTVQNYDPRTGKGTGFTFRPYTPAALFGALGRALDTFRKPKVWKTLQLAGMRQDFSWDRSAREYVKLYEKAVAARRTGAARPNVSRKER